jgi:Lrp/AsnC family transcriptional regulator, leucine-responsive regulatory protein
LLSWAEVRELFLRRHLEDSFVDNGETTVSFRENAMPRKNLNRKAKTSPPSKIQKTFSARRGSGLIDDPVDRKLLGLLKENARATYAELGKRAHLSAPAVYARIRRLERTGVIQSHTVSVDPATIGLPFCAFIRIGTAGDHGCEDIVASLAKNPEIEECHSIAGEDTVLVKARTPSAMELEYLIRRIRSIPGIVTTVTTVVLLTYFERGVQIPTIEDNAPGRNIGASPLSRVQHR